MCRRRSGGTGPPGRSNTPVSRGGAKTGGREGGWEWEEDSAE